MKYISTRGGAPAVGLSEAILASLAPDGGLYVPEKFPRVKPVLSTLPEMGRTILAPYFAGDLLEDKLSEIADAAFSFPAPVRSLGPSLGLLELFHGPTAAFKDFGARFLAECVVRMPLPPNPAVLVATSGDTGGAVAAAFHGRPGIEVIVLFPKGRVSPLQEHQLTAWGGNVRAYAVRGSFDDCQRLVKQAFQDRRLRSKRPILSANSINLGRFLPQQVYFARAAMEWKARTGRNPGFVVPTGNLGNATAALYAKQIGFPIEKVALALNANTTIREFYETGTYVPAPSLPTLANAMDVGAPSNIERLEHLFPDDQKLRAGIYVVSSLDEALRREIQSFSDKHAEAICPHTAAGFAALEKIPAGDWIVAATAHPAKFREVVEPILGRQVPMPESLRAILARPAASKEIGTRYDDFLAILTKA